MRDFVRFRIGDRLLEASFDVDDKAMGDSILHLFLLRDGNIPSLAADLTFILGNEEIHGVIWEIAAKEFYENQKEKENGN